MSLISPFLNTKEHDAEPVTFQFSICAKRDSTQDIDSILDRFGRERKGRKDIAGCSGYFEKYLSRRIFRCFTLRERRKLYIYLPT